MEKIIAKLEEIEKDLENLKKKHHSEGDEEYHQKSQIIERIIDRIYPEKDAKDLKNKLHRGIYFAGETDDAKEQEDYLYDIGLAIKVVKTIIEESELFGFDDFRPIKEKTETEWQVGSEKFGGFFRKKKSK